MAASRLLYTSHLEAMQNVLRLHKASSNASLKEISSSTLANASAIKQRLVTTYEEANSIFAELQETLSSQQDEMALFAKDLCKDQVKAVDEKLKECSNELDMSSPSIEIASDALHQIFRPEKKNRTRAIGSNMSKKRLQQVSLAKSVFAGSGLEIAEVQANMAEVNVKMDKLEGSMNNMQNNFGTLQELLVKFLSQQGNQAPGLTPTNITEIGLTSVDRPGIIKQNVTRTSKVTPERPMSNVNKKVEILNKEGVVVATGYVVTDERHAVICHGKKVELGEKKVYIENVLIPDSPIYDAPQGGSNVLEDVVEGGFLIWLECRLKY